MHSYAISYDLIGPNRDYDKIIEAIKSYGTWAHINESLWIVRSNKTSAEIRDHLKQNVDTNDKILVVQLTGVGAWLNLSSDMSDWLKNNL